MSALQPALAKHSRAKPSVLVPCGVCCSSKLMPGSKEPRDGSFIKEGLSGRAREATQIAAIGERMKAREANVEAAGEFVGRGPVTHGPFALRRAAMHEGAHMRLEAR